ncbi:MAG: rhodanese-like domain-containing protein [Burkholderiales bacterium]
MSRNIAIALLAAASAGSAFADFKVLVNSGDQGEQTRGAIYTAWRNLTDAALKSERLINPSWTVSTSTTEDLSGTRSRSQDVIVGPAHLIGSAIRYGYTPVLGIEQPAQAVLVTSAASPINSLEQTTGKKLGLPLQDSLVTYLVRGELNAANTTIKSHFASVFHSRYQDALLFCLQMQMCDVIAVERSVYDRWIAEGNKLKVVLSSTNAPGLSVAIKNESKPGVAALQSELKKAIAKPGSGLENVKFQSLSSKDFEYVSTLGYFTPRLLPGAKVLDAAGVAALAKQGARIIDTRTAAEFKEGHIDGSTLVPYVEKSSKDADFDASLDKFDIDKLGEDRNAALVFACNGAECWKSFKASHAAIKAGYQAVYWFRGGFPEWRSAGLKVNGATDKTVAAASGG